MALRRGLSTVSVTDEPGMGSAGDSDCGTRCWGARPSRSLCCASRATAPGVCEVGCAGEPGPAARSDSVGGTPADATGPVALPSSMKGSQVLLLLWVLMMRQSWPPPDNSPVPPT